MFMIAYVLILTGCIQTGEQRRNIIDINEKNINKVQMDRFRQEAEKYPKDVLAGLIKSVEQLETMDEADCDRLSKGDNYIPVSFIYENGEKDIFYFFESENTWYAESEDGVFYRNADFITEYITIEQTEVRKVLDIPLSNMRIWLKLENQFDTPDLEFAFLKHVMTYQENTDYPMEEAIECAKETMEKNIKLYLYMKKNGYEVKDKELSQEIENMIADYKTQENYSDYEKIYEEFGTTLEESVKKNREFIRFALMKNKLYGKLEQEFADGSDRINQTVYDTSDTYCKAFLDSFVYSQKENHEFGIMMSEVERAEQNYRQSNATVK